MSRRSVIAFAAAAIVAALATVGSQPLLRAAGHALIWEDPIQLVDVVVVPTWGGYYALLDAIDLIRDEKAARVAMITIPPDAAEREIERRGYGFDDWPTSMKNLLREGGVTDDQMVLISAPVGGTEDEIKQLAQWCRENRVTSILVLSTPEHTRRVHRTLARELPGTNALVRPTSLSPFTADNWWRSRNGLRDGLIEIQKLVLDLMTHPFN